MKNLKTPGLWLLVTAVMLCPCTLVWASDVEVSITPERLKLDGGKQGNPWVTCHVTLPDGYDAEEVTKDNTLLEGELVPVRVGVCDYDPQIVVIHFDKDDVIEYLKGTGQTGTVELTVTIELEDETLEGLDTIKVK